MGLKTHLAMEVKNSSKTAGCVCFVTHSPTVTKPLALGMSLLCSGEGTPHFYGGSEGAHLASAAPSPGRRQSNGKGPRNGPARKLPGPLFKQLGGETSLEGEAGRRKVGTYLCENKVLGVASSFIFVFCFCWGWFVARLQSDSNFV